MKKSIMAVILISAIGMLAFGGTVLAKNTYNIDDLKNLQDFLLARETPDLRGKDYDLNGDDRWDVFDLCLMKREFINQQSNKIEFGDQIRDDFIVDNVLHSDSQGDIHFSSYIPKSYDGSEPYALFITLPGWEGLYFQGVSEKIQ